MMTSRRTFLTWIAKGGLLLGFAGATGIALRFLDPPITSPRPAPVPVGPTSVLQPGERRWLPEARAWLIRDDSGYHALSAICPHLGCALRAAATTGFVCPCHGSRFAENGALL